MFQLKSRQRSVLFLFQQALHNLLHPPIPMAYMIGNTISQYSSISNYHSSSSCCLSFPFLQNLIYANHFGVNRNAGFTIKDCVDTNWNSNNVYHKAKARAFASPPRPPLFADLKNISLRDDECDATSAKVDDRLLKGSPSKPLGFHDHPLSEKTIVAVDVDEVLGNFVSALNRFIADRYSSNYSVSEYHVYEFFKIWNCSRDEADIRVHEFFKTSYFKSGIHPIPGAQMALQKLSRFCNLSVVTSRQNTIKVHTIEWIEKNYPGLFQEIHFGNHFALDGVSRPKSEICRSLGAKVLIDDNPRYAIECAEAGIRVLLFDYENSYPWCKTDCVDQHPLVTRVHNWKEVEHQLMSWVAR
ncbi:Haloacid dehalogenase-like hydrolase (HAD) superfamily protein [Quillaja saponaria]|uniref:Haloacid dehalogenase-like hydrolase (HAD) superfamily protein n=1 Tax=Quillaja saponaria TaxID=32244 RepID=A0AAD7PHV2_QUISA|nr:Haloacid dehalogenase-like hydrolase (HAD) superfamily protein [Quillaja saponaria]